MFNLKTRLILVTALGFLLSLIGISCLTLFPMQHVINSKLFKMGSDDPSKCYYSSTTYIRQD